MKNNGMTTILNWALLAGAFALLVCGLKYYNKTKTVRTYQSLIGQATALQNNQNAVNALLSDTAEYAKTHPAINPVFEAIVGKQAAAAATKPATK
jgi:hypothetical protein